jgi:hypothetical protein
MLNVVPGPAIDEIPQDIVLALDVHRKKLTTIKVASRMPRIAVATIMS